jgi:NNP family nitrate/nitrite transporter-like MFS transporter
VILLAIYYLAVLSRMVFAPLLPIFEVEFGLTHGQAGSLFLIVASGQCIGLLGSGILATRWSHRWTIFLSMIISGTAMLTVSQSVSVYQVLPGIVMVGAALGLYFPSGMATLTELISHEHWGKAIALHEMAPNLAFITAPLILEALLRLTPWRGIPLVLGILSIVVGLLFLFFGPKTHLKGTPPNPRAIRQVVQHASFWVLALLLGLSVGAESGVYSMLPLFLANEMGFARESANSLVGLSRVPGLLILFFSGLITDRMGHKRAAVLFLAIMGTLTLLLGMVRGPLITPILIVLQAASLPCFWPGALAVLSQAFAPPLRSLGVSLVVLSGILWGVGAIPSAIGHLAEVHSFSFGFTLLGGLILAALPLTLTLRPHTEVQ